MTYQPDLSLHPCFSEKAHHYFSRIHLPVAPRCNIQCNYCNRKYDCVNESRPGVTSAVLTPEAALQLVHQVAARRRDLSVVGIAGPGDALANPGKTFRTLAMVRKAFPDLLLCLSTNGLELVNYIDDFTRIGVNHVTVTINTLHPEIATQIYSHVRLDGQRRKDMGAVSEFLYRQEAGVKALVQAGILVKANSILIPGLNDKEMVGLSKRLRLMGVALHNILPLIATPETGSLFSRQGQPEPDHEELESIRAACGSTRQMAHCRQCRADAVGRLGENAFTEIGARTSHTSTADPKNGLEEREHWRRSVRDRIQSPSSSCQDSSGCSAKGGFSGKIAVCTQGLGRVEGDLQFSGELYIYKSEKGSNHLINVRRIDHKGGMDRNALFTAIQGCSAVISPKIGYRTFKALENRGVLPVSDLGGWPIEKAVEIAVQRLNSSNSCSSRMDLSAVINH